MATVVVGVDGSGPSQRALDWAADEARLRGWGLRAVYAWRYPMTAVEMAAPDCAPEELEALAHQGLDTAVDRADLHGIDGGVERVVVGGDPGRVLVETCDPDDLLVVGARGLGLASRLLLGSVSTYAVHHAPCAVLVVRE